MATKCPPCCTALSCVVLAFFLKRLFCTSLCRFGLLGYLFVISELKSTGISGSEEGLWIMEPDGGNLTSDSHCAFHVIRNLLGVFVGGIVVLHAKISSIIFLAICLYGASVNCEPLADCKPAIAELEQYMLNDIKSVLPSESMFWASGVDTTLIAEGRAILAQLEKCTSGSAFLDKHRELRDTYDLMLFYLNQIAEDPWYMKIIMSFLFDEEVFIRDYNEIMTIIATLKSSEPA